MSWEVYEYKEPGRVLVVLPLLHDFGHCFESGVLTPTNSRNDAGHCIETACLSCEDSLESHYLAEVGFGHMDTCRYSANWREGGDDAARSD